MEHNNEHIKEIEHLRYEMERNLKRRHGWTAKNERTETVVFIWRVVAGI